MCWTGPSGVWNNAANWSNGVPNAGTNAFIDNGRAQASAVTLNIAGAQVLNLNIDSDDGLGFSNGTSLTVNGSISNAGSITLNSTGNFTELIVGTPRSP